MEFKIVPAFKERISVVFYVGNLYNIIKEKRK